MNVNHYTQVQDKFQKWVLFKDRLERGINILSNLHIENIPDFSTEILNEMILACVSIDYSLEIPNEKNCKKSMKQALRQWLIANYSFDNLVLTDADINRLSKNFIEKILVQQQGKDNNYKLLSCCYTRCNPNDDEKAVNEVYLREFENKWKEGKRRLDEKCRIGLVGTAEPKMVGMYLKNRLDYLGSTKNSIDSSTKITEYVNTDRKKECDSKYFQAKKMADFSSPLKEQPKETCTPLTASCYSVSTRRFQKFLSFGIHYLLELEKQQSNQIAENIEREKLERQQTAKNAHLLWMKQKSAIDTERRKRLMEEHEKEETRQENMKRQMENEKKMFEVANLDICKEYQEDYKRPPKTPRLWADISQCDENIIAVCWTSDDGDSATTQFIVSVYTEKDSQSPSMTEHFYPPADDQVHDFRYHQQLYFLQPGSRYWFGVKSVNHYGVSFESRLEILSKPAVPSCPILCEASDCVLTIRWDKESVGMLGTKRVLTTGGTNITELTAPNPREVIFIVETCVDFQKNEWLSIWRGQTNDAIIGGLTENSSYLMRVRAFSNELDSGPGDSALFHTLMKKPHCPSVATKIKNAVGRNCIQLSWNSPSSWQNAQSTTCLPPNIKQLAPTIFIDKYVSNYYEEHGCVCLENLHHVLRKLGINKLPARSLRSLVKEYQKKSNVVSFDDSTTKISIEDLLSIWNECTVSILYMSEENPKETQHIPSLINDGRACIVYEGSEDKAVINGLIPNKNYYFFIQHMNLRGTSLMSRIKRICTLPENPTAVDVIAISNSYVWLRVRVNSRKGQGWARVRIRMRSQRTNEWKNVYVGNSLVIQIPNLRPSKTYEFECDLLNINGVPGDSICKSVTTSNTTPFLLTTDTIPVLFRICCSELSDVVEGDLILFAEIMRMESGKHREKATVARVMNIIDHKCCLKIEVQWCSLGNIQSGAITNVNATDIFLYEVLRVEWIDESYRLLS